jgi:hypothetical protein
VIVRGRLDRDEESARLLATEIVALPAACVQAIREVAIRLSIPPHDRRTFEALAGALERHRGDRRVALDVELRGDAHRLVVHAAIMGEVRVRPSESLVGEIEGILGKGAVTLR